MKLVLDLLGPPRLMGARQRSELRAGSLSIGRSPEADWVIPDTERLISRLHLRVDASHGAFVLTDTSANGVYVNGRDEPVGYGASVRLRDGDKLLVGEARIAVTIEEGRPADPPGAPLALDADAFAPPAPRDPLGGPFGAPFAAAPRPIPSKAIPSKAVSSMPGAAMPGASSTGASSTAGGVPAAAPAARASEPPLARTVIDANWMNEPADAAPAAPDAATRQERGRPVILPLRPAGPDAATGAPAPLRAVAGGPPEAASVLALVEARPDLSVRRLAAAVDAAARAMDPQAGRELQRTINALVESEPP